MKSIIKSTIVGLFCGLVLLSTACTNLDEFGSSKLAEPVSLSVVVAQVKDSAVKISATNPSDGYITVGLFKDPGAELDLDAEAFFSHNYEGITFVTVKATKDVPVQVVFTKLLQHTDYVVYGVSSNADGVVGNLVNRSFSTSDSHAPKLLFTNPEVDEALTPTMPLTGELVLEFDEPVLYDSTKLLQYYFYFDDETALNEALNVAVEGNRVTITSDSISRNSEYIFVSWAEGTFKDASDNPVQAKSSGFDDEGYPYGLFFCTESKIFVPTITPTTEDSVSVADLATIVLTFEEKVFDFHANDKAGSTLTYEDADGNAVTKALKQTDFDFSISDKAVTLTPPMAPVSGQKVTLKLNASSFYVGLYNPSAAIKVSWVVK